MPDDPNRPGEPQRDVTQRDVTQRDINGDPLPPPRPLPNNPPPEAAPPSSPPPSSPPPPSFGGAQQYGQPGAQPGGPPDQQSYDLAGNPLPPPGSAPPPQSPYYTAPPGGQPPPPYGSPQGGQQSAWPPPPGSPYGQPQGPYGQAPGPYGQPQYYPVQVNGNQILTMGILAFFCFSIILGPMAYVQGNSALAAIDRGEADPAQRGNVAAGRICGLIAGIMGAVGGLFYIVVILIGALSGSHP